jgi:hypothetical protein
MVEDLLRYDRMVQSALMDVVREALRTVAEHGFPGNHHFYVTFRSNDPGVEIPDHLRISYPEEMTIVLQHQFYGLEVHPDHFEVTLSFRKALERLVIPFASVTAFVDPSVNFGLKFEIDGDVEPTDGQGEPDAGLFPDEPRETAGGERPPEGKPEEKVVSLEQFRKK